MPSRRILLPLVCLLCANRLAAAPLDATPTISLIVNGVDYGPSLHVSGSEGVYTFRGSVEGPGFTMTAAIFTNADPIIEYDLSYQSDPCSGSGSSCSIGGVPSFFLIPFVDGPWDALASSLQLVVTDTDGNGGVFVNPILSGGVALAAGVDGTTYHQLGDGCSQIGLTPGSSVICDSAFLQTVIPSTGPTGLLGLAIGYGFGLGDLYQLTASVALVPEPSVWTLAAGGLVLIGFGRRWNRLSR